MEKENFEFYLDKEVATFYRHRFSVKATSLEEATTLVTETLERGGLDEMEMLGYCNPDDFRLETTEYDIKRVLYTEDGDFICEVI